MEGGLRIKQVESQNYAAMLKHLWNVDYIHMNVEMLSFTYN
jgi:hypothetical protein